MDDAKRAKILEILAAVSCEETIHADATMAELGMESLDVLDFVQRVEGEFGIQIPDSAFECLNLKETTVSDIIKTVDEHADKQSDAAGPKEGSLGRVRLTGKFVFIEVGPENLRSFDRESLATGWSPWSEMEAALKRLEPRPTQREIDFLGQVPVSPSGRNGYKELCSRPGVHGLNLKSVF